MQRRQKVGGILDRRFGENDPTMDPEERALERFVREKQKGNKKSTLFDLEDDEDDGEELTHFGKSLSFEAKDNGDDFEEAISDDDADVEGTRRGGKRRKLSDDRDQSGEVPAEEAEIVPEPPKTKQEVMKEVVAKSKLYRYERQKAKEDDDMLRAELDSGLSDVYALLHGSQPQAKPPNPLEARVEPMMNPARAALLEGKDRAVADREYDERLRQIAFDARSKPTMRTKTQEEIAEEEAGKLKELEKERLGRMRGEESQEDDGDDDGGSDIDEYQEPRLAKDVDGTANGSSVEASQKELGVEDEDEFVLDDDLIATGSEAALSDNEDSGESSESEGRVTDEEDAEFVQGLISAQDAGRQDLDVSTKPGTKALNENGPTSAKLAFTYPCPQSHDELLEITKNTSLQDLPTIIQRIRALYHPKLNSENKDKMGHFSAVLLEHIFYLANQPVHPSFGILETLIRHLHSLAKSFPEEVGTAFRNQLRSIQNERPIDINDGDMVMLTAVRTIFPTSDHFHQVVTPAMLTMARHLGQKIPCCLADLVKGLYLVTLCLQYQRLSKRYVPEAVNYVLNVFAMIVPAQRARSFGPYPDHTAPDSLRIGKTKVSLEKERRIRFWDSRHKQGEDPREDERLKIALLDTALVLVQDMDELWRDKSAYQEIFTPFAAALAHLSSKANAKNLPSSTKVSYLPIRPLPPLPPSSQSPQPR